jgi:hypothetical protein
MQPGTSIDDRALEITRIVEGGEEVTHLLRHLKEVTDGAAFKSSFRSGQFLRYIVEQAIAGHFDSLKERVIGVELFGRSPSYDTGDDAVVRVTASDVRRRLLQHYGRYGSTSEYRISLPVGSYIPEFTRDFAVGPKPVEVDANHTPAAVAPYPEPFLVPLAAATIHSDHATAQPEHPQADGSTGSTRPSAQRRHAWLSAGVAIVLFILGSSVLYFRTRPAAFSLEPVRVNPWITFFSSTRPTQIITSDPNIVEIQGFTGGQITASDYANHNYFAGPNKLTPEQDNFCRIILRGDKAATVDTQIAVNIAQLAQSSGRSVSVHGARSIRLSDLRTEDNFVLLGSPRSDPWSGLFNDQLDFQFVFDKALKQEFIHNLHPRAGEQANYIPTAPGWATGQSYAIIAVVRNPDQNGNVILLAGADAEGTEAAGELITDSDRLSNGMKKCGLQVSGPLHHFEMLLHLSTMAGSPHGVDVTACHVLPDGPGH